MIKILTISCILFLVGCANTSPSVIEEPTLPVEKHVGAVFCEHKYDFLRNFTYTPPIKEYKHSIMGEIITTYEFLLTNGQKHFLSSIEQDNYQCKTVD